MKACKVTASTWPRQSVACVWANGKIDVLPALPQGALPLAAGPRYRLRRLVNSRARLAYDGRTHLCPGVPEGATGEAKLNAVRAFGKELQEAIQGAR
ncbi:host nuclease inhibitor protein [Desulfovibrio psychrotolerans]|uniref:Uncharacterized protein n=1 Tax=Desulfovibrio psychrotolerans TaxID=415242 RepID=A0A7J0BXP8_9BACT|nr:host nuclease inhibitor protein [Desulfovibrio psychrotolerans]GFM37965.1 hypothetical protein DSM19430T_26490 [Desulfovibrio psychrotolerans]